MHVDRILNIMKRWREHAVCGWVWDGTGDDIATEVEVLNEDWAVGVYAGREGVFPRNHVRSVGGG